MEKLWFFTLLFAVHGAVRCRGEVTYDGRSLIIDGQRKILFSGSIHYPRSTPEMWPSLISKAKDGGIDVIDTYVFWNLHEPQLGQYDFSGRRDIVGFIKEIQAQGLFACLRIGPFIEAEWSYGGLPFWLRDIQGIIYRSDNEPFKVRMQNFTTKIVTMLQSEKLFASQGGPIILSQIENEYSMVEGAFHEKGPPYVKWAAEMAVGLNTGVPWVMCKQDDAPDPLINACNGMKCGETFVGPNSPNKPSIWTENWTTRYKVYGEDMGTRSVEDIAFHVALFIAAKNGSFVNYYMYHGGTNFGRTTSAFVPTSYYDEAPLDEFGMIRQPKWGHLKELHAAIKLCSVPLLSGTMANFSLNQSQIAYVFNGQSPKCAAFLVNHDTKDSLVIFGNSSYDLPAESISILPDCKNVAFNTAKVSTQQNTREIVRGQAAEIWEEFKEVIPNFDDTSMKSDMLLEHTNTTKDSSDYLWYTLRYDRNSSDTQEAVLNVSSLGHVLHAFVNGKAVGSAHGSHKDAKLNMASAISLSGGTNNISLLSAMVGLPDSGPYLERKDFGPNKVTIQAKEDNNDLITNYSWGYQVGLVGEKLQLFTDQGSRQVQWNRFSGAGNPLTWYKTTFDGPKEEVPVALNMGSMGKGEAWINGQSIGRYWPSNRSPSGDSQIWYHVPGSFLKPTGNLLVVMEEEGGNPLEITLDTATVPHVCSHVSTSHLPPVCFWERTQKPIKKGTHHNNNKRPKVRLACPSNTQIYNISFASYGTPLGTCGTSYALGHCHSSNSSSTIEKACIGRRRCSVPLMNHRFGYDPCPGIPKSLLVVADCK